MARLRYSAVLTVLALGALGLALNACGWRLRGSAEGISLNGQAFYVVDRGGAPDLRSSVRRNINSAGGRYVESRSDADLILVLHSISNDRETAAVGVGGDAKEYRLEYRITYSLEEAAGEMLLEHQTARARRTFAATEGGADTRQVRQADIEQELRDEAIRMIFLRLQVFL